MRKKGEIEDSAPAEAAPKPKKQRPGKSGIQSQGSGIMPFAATSMGATLALVIALALAMGWMQFGQHQQRSAEQLATTSATQQAALINTVLRDTQALAETLALSPLIAEAFSENQDLDQASERLSSMLPDAKIVLVGSEELLPRGELSFVARDLVQRARRDGSSPLIVITGEPANALVAWRTADGNGVMLLDRRLGELFGQLGRLDLQGGYLRLDVDGTTRPLLERGTLISGPTAAQEAIGGIQISYTAQTDTGDGALQALFITLVIGTLALISVILVLTFRSVSAALKKDAALLTHYIEDLLKPGHTNARGRFTFTPFSAASSALDKLQAGLNAQKLANQPARKPRSKPDPMLEMMIDEPDTATAGASDLDLPPEEIFREYDIRGIVGQTLTESGMLAIGRAIGSEAAAHGQRSVIVGRDGRHSSPSLAQAISRGITDAGLNVIDIGAVPTPVLYYAAATLNTQSGVVITGSHNPSEYNGVKIVIAGETLHGDRIRALRTRIETNDLSSGDGHISDQNVDAKYTDAITQDIVLARSMKVVIDCGNGITGAIAPALFEALGCEVIPLFTEVDGDFPNHHPDPGKPENLVTLIETVKQAGADIGIAFDGDGDRLGIVTPSGELIWPDRLMMLYARDILSRSPGADIIFDVKCSRELGKLITRMGGRPLMWKSGHSLIKAKLRETGAPLAGEMSGHIFFADRWHGFDDGLYSAARLLEILSLESASMDEVFARLKTGFATPEFTLEVGEARKFEIIKSLGASADEFEGGNVSTLDGLRVDFEDGWGLIRASNTTPMLTARFEGRDKGALERIQTLFREKLRAVDNSIDIPF